MKINSWILHDYMHIKSTTSIIHASAMQQNLEGIAFFRNKENLDFSLIYLISNTDLEKLMQENKKGVYACIGNVKENIPAHMDVFLFDKKIDIYDIYEDLQRVFQRFNQWERKLYQQMEENASLKTLGDCGREFLYNPVCMYTASLQNVFYSERKKPERLMFFKEDEVGAYLPDEEIDELKLDEDFIKTVSKNEPDIFPDYMWGYRILYYNIRVSGIYVARLMACEIERPFNKSDHVLLAFLADFVKKAMEKQNISFNNHPKDFDLYMQRLLRNEDVDKEKLNEILNEWSWHIDDSYFCALIKSSNYDRAVYTVTAVCSRLESNLAGSAAILNEDDIILIVNLRKGNTSKEELLLKMAYILREGLMKAGISRSFYTVLCLKDYYEQAKAALLIGNTTDETIWCYHYKSYALHNLLARAKGAYSLDSLCPEGLRHLIRYDQEHKRNFTNSLKVYLQQDMSIVKTIEILYLQRASFLYQLKRIKEITGLDFNDRKIRLELLIVFELMDLE